MTPCVFLWHVAEGIRRSSNIHAVFHFDPVCPAIVFLYTMRHIALCKQFGVYIRKKRRQWSTNERCGCSNILSYRSCPFRVEVIPIFKNSILESKKLGIKAGYLHKSGIAVKCFFM